MVYEHKILNFLCEEGELQRVLCACITLLLLQCYIILYLSHGAAILGILPFCCMLLLLGAWSWCRVRAAAAAAAAELLDSGTDGPNPAKQQSPSVPPSLMHANHCVQVLLVVAATGIA